MTKLSGRAVAALASVLALTGVLSACSSTGSDSQDAGPGYTLAFVTHETPGDTFWDKVKAGAEQAADDYGITLKYSNDPDPAKQATLIQNAVDSKVDGIATTLATPDALKGSVQIARKAGTPVVALNAGLEQYKEVGAMMYFGSDESVAGEAVGARIADAGGTKALCVIHQSGSVALEARCDGVKKAFPNTENIQVNGADDPSVVASLTAKLKQDPSIDYVVTLTAPVALGALQAKESTNSETEVVTFDLNADVTKRIQDKTIAFSVDQQPYVQGYLAVTSLYLNLKNANDIGGGGPVLTGPSFIDAENIDAIAKYAESGTR